MLTRKDLLYIGTYTILICSLLSGSESDIKFIILNLYYLDLKHFVGHGRIYVNKERSIVDLNIYNFNLFSFKWFWSNFKYFCFVACSAWYSNTSVESSQSPKRVFIIYWKGWHDRKHSVWEQGTHLGIQFLINIFN